MVAFGVLAFFAVLGWPRTRYILIFERLSFFGAAIELLQATPWIHRNCDPVDWLADTAAVAVVLAGCIASSFAPKVRKGKTGSEVAE